MLAPDTDRRTPGKIFALTLGLTALITPLAVHLFFPVIPAVKVALGLARGKQVHDKREAIKKRETDRETRAAVKHSRR